MRIVAPLPLWHCYQPRGIMVWPAMEYMVGYTVGHAAVEGWNIGLSGDLLAVDVAQLLDFHLVIAGPPCPSWSSIRLHGGSDDVRAQVLFKTSANNHRPSSPRGLIRICDREGARHGTCSHPYRPWGGSSVVLQPMVSTLEMKDDLPDFDIHFWCMQTSD